MINSKFPVYLNQACQKYVNFQLNTLVFLIGKLFGKLSQVCGLVSILSQGELGQGDTL